MRLFIRIYNTEDTVNGPDVDDEVLTEAELNGELARGQKPSDFRELVPIKTDVRQVKQTVVI